MRPRGLGTPESTALQVQGQRCTATGKITNPSAEPHCVTSASCLHKSTVAPRQGPKGKANNADHFLCTVTNVNKLTINIIYTRVFPSTVFTKRCCAVGNTDMKGDTHLTQEAQSDEHPLRQQLSYLKATFPAIPHFQCRDRQAFPVKGQIVINALESLGHTISVAKIQACCVPQKQSQTVFIKGHNCVSIKFYLQKLAAGDLPEAHRPDSANPCFRARQRTQKEAKRLPAPANI